MFETNFIALQEQYLQDMYINIFYLNRYRPTQF